MENDKQIDNKKKTILLIIGLIVVVAIVVAIFVSTKQEQKPGQTGSRPGTQTPSEQIEGEGIEGEDFDPIDLEGEVSSVLEGAAQVAPGANYVNKDGKVIDDEGNEILSNARYDSPSAPRQTQALENPEEIDADIRLTLSAEDGFNPSEVTVNRGQAVTMLLTGTDEHSHGITFSDEALSGVFINIRPGETRGVTFNAPDVAGEYGFHCGIPGHDTRGEVATLIVR